MQDNTINAVYMLIGMFFSVGVPLLILFGIVVSIVFSKLNKLNKKLDHLLKQSAEPYHDPDEGFFVKTRKRL